MFFDEIPYQPVAFSPVHFSPTTDRFHTSYQFGNIKAETDDTLNETIEVPESNVVYQGATQSKVDRTLEEELDWESNEDDLFEKEFLENLEMNGSPRVDILQGPNALSLPESDAEETKHTQKRARYANQNVSQSTSNTVGYVMTKPMQQVFEQAYIPQTQQYEARDQYYVPKSHVQTAPTRRTFQTIPSPITPRQMPTSYASFQEPELYAPLQTQTSYAPLQSQTAYAPLQSSQTSYAPLQSSQTSYAPLQSQTAYAPLQSQTSYATHQVLESPAPRQNESAQRRGPVQRQNESAERRGPVQRQNQPTQALHTKETGDGKAIHKHVPVKVIKSKVLHARPADIHNHVHDVEEIHHYHEPQRIYNHQHNTTKHIHHEYDAVHQDVKHKHDDEVKRIKHGNETPNMENLIAQKKDNLQIEHQRETSKSLQKRKEAVRQQPERKPRRGSPRQKRTSFQTPTDDEEVTGCIPFLSATEWTWDTTVEI